MRTGTALVQQPDNGSNQQQKRGTPTGAWLGFLKAVRIGQRVESPTP